MKYLCDRTSLTRKKSQTSLSTWNRLSLKQLRGTSRCVSLHATKYTSATVFYKILLYQNPKVAKYYIKISLARVCVRLSVCVSVHKKYSGVQAS